MCTLFTCLTRFAVESALYDSFGLKVSAVAMVTTPPPKIVKKCYFCAFVPLQTFCARFSHASYNSQLTSTHTCSSSLGDICRRYGNHSPNLSKNCYFCAFVHPQDIICTLFTYLKRFTFEFDTNS